MSLNDSISDFLTRVRNAIRAHKDSVDVPASTMIGHVLDLFKTNGYIEDFRLMKTTTQGSYKVYLKYDGKKSVITGLRRISKPGLRVYSEKVQLPKVLNGLGLAVISTSKGVMTDKDARKANVGGEVVCYIW